MINTKIRITKRKLLVETLDLSLPASPEHQQNSVGGARTLNEMTLENVQIYIMCVGREGKSKESQRQTKRCQRGAKSMIHSAL